MNPYVCPHVLGWVGIPHRQKQAVRNDSGILVRNHALYFGLVGFIDHGVQVQTPFGLLRFGSKNMAHERVPTLHSTAGGLLEAFSSATVGL